MCVSHRPLSQIKNEAAYIIPTQVHDPLFLDEHVYSEQNIPPSCGTILQDEDKGIQIQRQKVRIYYKI